MSLQQVVVEDGSQSEGLTLQTIDKHLLLRHGTGCPLHVIDLAEEYVDVLDTILAGIPLRHGIVVGSPRSVGHVPVGTGGLIGDSVVGGYIRRRGSHVRQALVGIDEQAVGVRRLFIHGFLLTVVLVGRTEHVVARTEQHGAK